jgi:hypothetical protein
VSPTARTLAWLRENGWTAHVVEKNIRIPGGRMFKRDCFGFDVLACKAAMILNPQNHILGIQACAATDHARRKDKLLRNPQAAIWLAAGGRLAVWSWRLGGLRGKRKTWTLRQDELLFTDFVPADQPREAIAPSPDYVGKPQPIDTLLRDAASALRILGDSPLVRDIEATRAALAPRDSGQCEASLGRLFPPEQRRCGLPAGHEGDHNTGLHAWKQELPEDRK